LEAVTSTSCEGWVTCWAQTVPTLLAKDWPGISLNTTSMENTDAGFIDLSG
jgi:hypothetical protein